MKILLSRVFAGLSIKPCLLILLSLLSWQAYGEHVYPFATKKQESQFHHLLHELRCLVCQNQDLSDSNAQLAKDLRREVYDMVVAGQSDSEIVNFLTERYGDFVLFKPPLKAITIFLWFGPFLFIMLGLFIFWRTFLKRVSNA